MPLEIFKPGKHTAMSGVTLEFTDEIVAGIAASYDPAVSQAPLVVGHPKHDDPAFGWVKSLAFDDGILKADPDQVDASFAEVVNAGRYKRISASFYTPDSPANPKPGAYYLRHVGFLGAAAPAVPGLKVASFADADGIGVLEFGGMDDDDLRPWEVSAIGDTFRSLRDWFIGKFGIEEADKAIPNYAIDSLHTAADRIAAAPSDDDAPTALGYTAPDPSTPAAPVLPASGAASQPAPAAGEGIKTEEAVPGKPGSPAPDDKAAEFAEREIGLKARETAIAEKERALHRADLLNFTDGLAKSGHLTPAMQEGLVDFMAGLDAAPALEFGEGDDKTTKPSLDFFKDFLGKLPKLVDFSDVSGGTAPAADADADAADFAAAPGFTADTAGLKELVEARAYAKTHNCTLMDALAAMPAGGK